MSQYNLYISHAAGGTGPHLLPRVIAYGLRRSGTPVKTVILGLVPRIARGTAVDFISKILMPVRLEILGTSPRMTVFGGNLPYAIPLGAVLLKRR